MINLARKYSYKKTLDKWFSIWGWAEYNPKTGETKMNLTIKEQIKAKKLIKKMAQACIDDFKKDYDIDLSYHPSSLQKIDQLITPQLRRELEKNSNRFDFSNLFLLTIIKIGSLWGEILIKEFGGEWKTVDPYWDSWISLGKKGHDINVFHMVIKRFSSEIKNGSIFEKHLMLREMLIDKP